mmetsp:Transcript_112773/g.329528  ORF Transcript_112773/g.329528 Transcript_112773/m.329528 type:complete len:207 (-) Transcript_112773:69-689(-)
MLRSLPLVDAFTSPSSVCRASPRWPPRRFWRMACATSVFASSSESCQLLAKVLFCKVVTRAWNDASSGCRSIFHSGVTPRCASSTSSSPWALCAEILGVACFSGYAPSAGPVTLATSACASVATSCTSASAADSCTSAASSSTGLDPFCSPLARSGVWGAFPVREGGEKKVWPGCSPMATSTAGASNVSLSGRRCERWHFSHRTGW